MCPMCNRPTVRTGLVAPTPGHALEVDHFSGILHGLIGEYQNLATVVSGNELVPADLRNAVAQHVAAVLGELPQQLREAARSAAGLEA